MVEWYTLSGSCSEVSVANMPNRIVPKKRGMPTYSTRKKNAEKRIRRWRMGKGKDRGGKSTLETERENELSSTVREDELGARRRCT